MKHITVIGSGNIGANLARLFQAKHSLTVGSRNPVATQAKLPGIQVKGYAEAVTGADIVVLAVPYGEVPALASSLGGLAGKIVIDVTNPLTPDYMALTIGHTSSAGEQVQSLFPKAKVVKAFNTVLAQVLAKAVAGATNLPTVLVAGNETSANAEVVALAQSIGFAAQDTGALANARYLEPLAELTIQLAYVKGHGAEVGFSFAKV